MRPVIRSVRWWWPILPAIVLAAAACKSEDGVRAGSPCDAVGRCPDGLLCVLGRCTTGPTCRSTFDCPGELECVSGRCVLPADLDTRDPDVSDPADPADDAPVDPLDTTDGDDPDTDPPGDPDTADLPPGGCRVPADCVNPDDTCFEGRCVPVGAGDVERDLDTAGQCAPCSTAADCPWSGALCVPDRRNELHCGSRCVVSADCPEGYVCRSYGDQGQACAPATGFCGASCLDPGATCPGTKICDSRTGACVDPPENVTVCSPCSGDADCGAKGRCIADASGRTFCGTDCSEAPCPDADSYCRRLSNTERVCWPVNNQCVADCACARTGCEQRFACNPVTCSCEPGQGHCTVTPCPAGQSCNPQDGTCAAGPPPSDLDFGFDTDLGGDGRCFSSLDCGFGERCDFLTGQCVSISSGCTFDFECPAGSLCEPISEQCVRVQCETCDPDDFRACNGPGGASCLTNSSTGENICAIDCTFDRSVCPADSRCQAVDGFSRYCLPRSGSCRGGTDVEPEPEPEPEAELEREPEPEADLEPEPEPEPEADADIDEAPADDADDNDPDPADDDTADADDNAAADADPADDDDAADDAADPVDTADDAPDATDSATDTDSLENPDYEWPRSGGATCPSPFLIRREDLLPAGQPKSFIINFAGDSPVSFVAPSWCYPAGAGGPGAGRGPEATTAVYLNAGDRLRIRATPENTEADLSLFVGDSCVDSQVTLCTAADRFGDGQAEGFILNEDSSGWSFLVVDNYWTFSGFYQGRVTLELTLNP